MNTPFESILSKQRAFDAVVTSQVERLAPYLREMGCNVTDSQLKAFFIGNYKEIGKIMECVVVYNILTEIIVIDHQKEYDERKKKGELR